jgi:hypothetical protein
VRVNGTRYETPGFAAIGGAAATPGTVRETQTGDLRAAGTLGAFDLELNANKNLKNAGSSGGGFFGGTERVPEVLFSTDGQRLRLGRSGLLGFLSRAGLRLAAGFGRYIEAGQSAGFGFGNGSSTPDREQTDRLLFNLDTNPAPIPLPARFQLALAGSFRQTVYSDDAAQYVLNFRPQLTQRLGPQSTFNLAYSYLRPYGFARSSPTSPARSTTSVRT